jgi:hypothetical protein
MGKAIAGFFLLAIASQASASFIKVNFVATGQDLPGFGKTVAQPATAAGGGNLADISNFAGKTWEDFYDDPGYVLNIDIGWFPLPFVLGGTKAIKIEGTPERITKASIALNSNNAKWFLDATPDSNEEYNDHFASSLMLGQKEINVANWFVFPKGAAADRDDALTTVLHEIGHALGIDDPLPNGDPLPNPIILDPPFPPMLQGTEIPTKKGHLNITDRFGEEEPTLMNPANVTGRRELPSMADIAAVAAIDDLTIAQPASPGPEPSSLTLLGFGILPLLGYAWRRRKLTAA